MGRTDLTTKSTNSAFAVLNLIASWYCIVPLLATTVVVFSQCAPALAQNQPASAPEIVTVLEQLEGPRGVAVQPDTGHVFVSESGSGCALRVVDGMAENVIVNFPQDLLDATKLARIGSLSLTFLEKDTLIIGGGGLPSGQDLIRVYTIGEAGTQPIDARQFKHQIGPLTVLGNTPAGENVFGVVATPRAIFAVCSATTHRLIWVVRAGRTGKDK